MIRCDFCYLCEDWIEAGALSLHCDLAHPGMDGKIFTYTDYMSGTIILAAAPLRTGAEVP